MSWSAQKLVLVLATSLLVTEASKKEDVSLKQVPCIHYLLCFQKDIIGIKALIHSDSEVNAITPAYTSKLGLKVYHTDVGAQKINDSIFEIFRMVLANFQVEDKLGRARFFQETFLLADISMEVVLGILFLTLSNADVQFVEKEFIWRSYTTAKALLTTKRVELINKKEFAKAALDKNSEIFVVHVAFLNLALVLGIYPDRSAQMTFLLTKEIKILEEYSDFTDIFLEEKALMLPERIEFNQHVIELEEGKQPLYAPIYSLCLVELETLKTYIETHLKTGFTQPSKSPIGLSILFDEKSNGRFCLFVDYRGLNNLTIKSRYPLPLIGESFD